MAPKHFRTLAKLYDANLRDFRDAHLDDYTLRLNKKLKLHWW